MTTEESDRFPKRERLEAVGTAEEESAPLAKRPRLEADQSQLIREFCFHLPACKSNSKKCFDHPNCVECLKRGIKSEGIWRPSVIQLRECLNSEEPIEELRDLDPSGFSLGNPQGLDNLGATCYLNCYLQCLFFNSTFRHLLFQHENKTRWEHPLPDTSAHPEDAPADPQLVLSQMQLLFAEMQCGRQVSNSPSRLARLFGLAVDHQQDIQEFTHILLSFLKHAFAESSNPAVRNVIDDQFRGVLVHTTICSRCRSESHRQASFYELCLPIIEDRPMEESLKAYLRPEPLLGANKYQCETCQDKCNATRAVSLLHLPPVLHIQLLKFVYDQKTFSKRKLHGHVELPLVLTFQRKSNRFTTVGNNESESEYTYDLQAVVYHTGETAHSGHYTVDLRCELTGRWFRFNDDVVSLSSTIGSKAVLSSRHAYLVLYGRRGRPLQRRPAPSPALLRYVQRHNRVLQTITDSFQHRKQLLTEFSLKRKCEIKEFWSSVSSSPPPLNGQGFIVSRRWLRSWLRGTKLPSESDERSERLFSDHHQQLHQQELASICPGPVVNAELLCEHGRLDPRKRRLMARVCLSAWKLLSSSGFDVELSDDAACLDCCAVIRREEEHDLQQQQEEEEEEEEEEAKQLDLTSRKLSFNSLSDEPTHSDDDVARLHTIFKNRRCFPSRQPPSFSPLFLVPAEWLERMGAWLKVARTAPHPGPVTTAELLCQHDQLLYTPTPQTSLDPTGTRAGILSGISSEEWSVLHRVFNATGPALEVRLESGDACKNSWAGVRTVIGDPKPCVECIQRRVEKERSNAAVFSAGFVCVMRVDVGANVADAEGKGSMRPRRRKSPPNPQQAVFNIKAHAQTTVVEFKHSLARSSGISVAQQRLLLDSLVLSDGDRSLQECGVGRNSIIHLELDAQQQQQQHQQEEERELGFFGTALYKAVHSMDAKILSRGVGLGDRRSGGGDIASDCWWVPLSSNVAASDGRRRRRRSSVLPDAQQQAHANLPLLMRLYTALAAAASLTDAAGTARTLYHHS